MQQTELHRKQRKLIRGLDLKVTDQRLLLLQLIQTGNRHFTAQETFESAQEIDSSIGFATVYRFLRDLHKKNFLSEVKVGGTAARYEIVIEKEHHDHLSCANCGLICEFENSQIESIQQKIAQAFGFKLTGHLHELYGLCASCQKLEPK